MTLKNYLTDDQIRQDSLTLAQLTGSDYKGIIAITRGGLAPALYLSQHLNIKDIRTISIASYGEDCNRSKLTIFHQPALENQGQGYLFLDDLVDSGETLRLIKQLYPKAALAVLYAKPAGRDTANFFAKEVPQAEWLVFPWEPDWIDPNILRSI